MIPSCPLDFVDAFVETLMMCSHHVGESNSITAFEIAVLAQPVCNLTSSKVEGMSILTDAFSIFIKSTIAKVLTDLIYQHTAFFITPYPGGAP